VLPAEAEEALLETGSWSSTAVACYGSLMMAKLTIVLSDEVLDALSRTKYIQVQLASSQPGRPLGLGSPKRGSLPAKVQAWADNQRQHGHGVRQGCLGCSAQRRTDRPSGCGSS
jgi:hypothetical protein